jgi:hypothetical protein
MSHPVILSPCFHAEPIAPERAAHMRGVSWHAGCPVSIENLRLLRVAHRDFDGRLRAGELVVHERLAEEVLAIFRDILAAGFPIHRLDTIEAFGGNDGRSMAANNSSGFNCRPNATTGQGYSSHSFGFAVDINPLQNPYARPEVDLAGRLLHPFEGSFEPPRVEPPEGRPFLDRRSPMPGMIRAGDAVHRAFAGRGWTWGGTFEGRTDYHHFEKWLPDCGRPGR